MNNDYQKLNVLQIFDSCKSLNIFLVICETIVTIVEDLKTFYSIEFSCGFGFSHNVL